MENRSVQTAVLRYLLVYAVSSAVIFLSAGTVFWAPGWIILGFGVTYLLFMITVGLRHFPEIVHHRSQKPQFEHRWDRAAQLVYGLSIMTIYVIGGTDHRLRWSATAAPVLVGGAARAVGTVLIALAFGVSIWVVATNRYAVATSRLQPERDHAVVDAGPYRLVRHPMYAASLMYFAGIPLLLGSYPAYLPAIFGVAALVFRAHHEDRMLLEGLPGYREYADGVRYRLIPMIW